MAQWNGMAMMVDPERADGGPHLYSDASGTFGCGACWDGQWFQLPWPWGHGYTYSADGTAPSSAGMYPVGESMEAMAHSDNMAVMEVVNSGNCKDGGMVQLLQILFFVKTR